MAKNKKKIDVGTQINAPLSSKTDAVASVEPTAVTTKAKKTKQNKNSGKTGGFSKIGRVFKEMFSELKKVSWLTPKTTMGRLGTVLLVVFMFLIVIMGFDYLSTWLLKLLVANS